MVEDRQGTRFPPESRHAFGVAIHVRRQHFECHVTAEVVVDGAIDLAHPARSQQLNHRVATQARARGNSVVGRAVVLRPQRGFGQKSLQAVVLLEKSIHTSAQFRLVAAGAVEKVTPLIRAQIQSFAKKLLGTFSLIALMRERLGFGN